YRALRRKVFGQRLPLTAGRQQVENAVQSLAPHRSCARGRHAWLVGLWAQHRPFGVGHSRGENAFVRRAEGEASAVDPLHGFGTPTNDSLRMLRGGCRCGSEMSRPLEIKMLLSVGATKRPVPYEMAKFRKFGPAAILLTLGRVSRCKGFQAR